jgi:dTDP-glucose 4,6-dehydratase
LPVAIIRPFNVYGPRQSARAVIPTIITQILLGKRKIKLGSLYPTRDFTFVKDTVRAFIAMVESEESVGEVINIGMSHEISIEDLVKLLAKLMDAEVEVELDYQRQRPEKSEVERLYADTTKAKKLLNWHPEEPLEQGLKKTIEWFKENLSLYKSEIYNV